MRKIPEMTGEVGSRKHFVIIPAQPEIQRAPARGCGQERECLYASASASCGAAAVSAGVLGSSAAATASSTRSSQMNSISLRAISGMSS